MLLERNSLVSYLDNQFYSTFVSNFQSHKLITTICYYLIKRIYNCSEVKRITISILKMTNIEQYINKSRD